MSPGTERRTYLKMAALAVGALPFFWRRASAQEIPLETAADADQISALRADVDALKKAVERLEKDASTIKAPLIVTHGEQEILSVAIDSDGSPRLRLRDGGGAAIGLGFQDKGSVIVLRDSGGGIRSQIAALPQSSQLVLDDGKAHIVLGSSADGAQSGFFLDREGQRHAQVSSAGEGGELALNSNAGKMRVKLSSDGKVPLALHDDGGASVVSFETDGGGAQMQLGSVDGAGVRVGLVQGGDGGFLSVSDRSKSERILMSSQPDTAPFTVSDAQGAELFTVSQRDGLATMTLGDPAKSHVAAGVPSSGAGAYLALFDGDARDRVTLSSDPGDLAVAIIDGQSKNVFSVDAKTDAVQMNLGPAEAAHLQTGVLSDGSGTYLSLYDNNKDERAFFSATATKTRMQLSDAEMALDLGRDVETDAVGLFLSKDKMNFAGLRFSKEHGGGLRLGDEAGKTMVTLGKPISGFGGSMVLNGPGGGGIAVRLGAAAAGGVLALDEIATGKPRAQLSATTLGSLDLYGDHGSVTATSGEAAPSFQLANSGDIPVVEAYITANGIGAIRVGPGGNGTAGTIGGGMQAASALVGKK